ncbi:MAG: hypothetical protein CTY31_08120 [Hyphomicrobium sp.]|nr:MAG: hypothetical protein CTY31_08120 [Hyphomicrobium sp.]
MIAAVRKSPILNHSLKKLDCAFKLILRNGTTTSADRTSSSCLAVESQQTDLNALQICRSIAQN